MSKELADRVVALGIGKYTNYGGQETWDIGHHCLHADDFCSSWLVAGALMEKCDDSRCLGRVFYEVNPGGYAHLSLPRAIIEACVEALEAS